MTQFSVIKNGLVPHDDDARAAMSKLKIGAVLDVELVQPMNVKFNSKIFAAIGLLAKMAGVGMETMKARLLVLTGRFDMVPLDGQRKVLVAHSMSRNAMTQAERESFWDDMRKVAREVVLPSLPVTPAGMGEINAIFGDDANGRFDETQGSGTRNSDAPDGVPATGAPRVNEPTRG